VTARRTLWWTLTVVLTLAVLAATTLDAWQLIRASRPTPADSAQARQTVLEVAKTSTAKMLSYTPENVESQLTYAATLATGAFHDSYTQLIKETVIPGANDKKITASASVPAVSVESLTASTATLVVFINQTVTVGSEKPTDMASSVRMRLEDVNGSWLVGAFDPL
jgi:Mce-associated membrane protein